MIQLDNIKIQRAHPGYDSRGSPDPLVTGEWLGAKRSPQNIMGLWGGGGAPLQRKLCVSGPSLRERPCHPGFKFSIILLVRTSVNTNG